ncbi:MAG: amino acid racemase [Pseudomonadota bacterium]|uniref:Racemase n=1 Tax=Qipengyuania flava TaxID=192812 RepID=A0A222EXA2_9SPHN|nr:amino acid racemase [Qipengyuania flava]KZX88955.1 aspartate racemase [Erythrobacter sp. HI0020]KZY15143.1 aspartate racemase [Erythrobacter sp. HI0037]KZY17557.1 aspartate racemase [Erythrobacter sp. HI0038]MEC7161447.1 amino acid racemase [Pseudomonadota bacterium]ASP30821.1 aspartate racemase [Qipengyuania flava]
MRKLGIIGGLSWISTRAYYERINKFVQKRSAPMASPPLLIESLDYAPIAAAKNADDWDSIAAALVESARRLESAGAEGLVVAANTMHKVYDRLTEAVSIPVLHIADAVGREMEAAGCTNAALLGTRFVMTESFYRQRLVSHGVDLLAPDPADVELVDGIIYKELMLGRVTRDAERALKTVITMKEKAGAEAIVLACTELELVVDTDANVLPVYDSTDIHCRAAADWILG